MEAFETIIGQLRALDATPLVVALVLGGLVGLQREIHSRPAGLRTHMLVCLASALLVLASRRLPAGDPDATRQILDPTRIAAGIVTGIGFLGAATVIRSGDMVRGITTGACIWGISAVGIAVGYEAYDLAITTTLMMLAVLVILDRVEGWITPVIYRRLVVRGRGAELPALSEAVRKVLVGRRIRVLDLEARAQPGNACELAFHLRCRSHFQAPETIRAVMGIEGVAEADWSGEG